MKKNNTYKIDEGSINPIVSEPSVYYSAPITPQFSPTVKEFSYKEFKKIANKSPFTMAEWATLLYTSERTIQRYAQSNSSLTGLHLERILLLEKLIDAGNSFFGKEFYNWLHTKLFNLHYHKPFDFLDSYEGIQEIISLIHRTEQGIY